MELQRFPSTAAMEDVARGVREHGYAIIEKVVSGAVMDRIEAELRPWLDATPYGQDVGFGFLTRRTGALIARSPAARDLVMNGLVLGTVADLLSHASTMQVSLTETIFLSPRSQAQVIHRDEVAFDGYPFKSDYDVMVNTLWAMSDYTEEMGATRIIPGSHRSPPDLKFEQRDTIAAEMPRGSVLVYSGKIYHGSGENKSDRVRQAINIGYAVGWIRQEENQYLSCPPEIARTLPENLLRLMGYQCASGIGHVGDRMDPLGVVLEKYHDARAVLTPVPGVGLLTDIYIAEAGSPHSKAEANPP